MRPCKLFSVSLLAFILTPVYAKPCIDGFGSCFKLNNHLSQATRIACHTGDSSYLLQVEADAATQSSFQFDTGMNDGLGYPGPDQLDCEVIFADGAQCYHFNVKNPFWEPTIAFELTEKKLSVIAFDRWSGRQQHNDFTW